MIDIEPVVISSDNLKDGINYDTRITQHDDVFTSEAMVF